MPLLKKLLTAIGVVVVILIIFGIFNIFPFFIVSPGEAAVVTRLGKIVKVAYPGFYFKVPLIDGVYRYTTRLLTYETSDNPDASQADYRDYPVDTTTQDGQPIKIKYTVRFRIDPEKVQWVFENIGKEEGQVVEKIVKADSRVNVRVIARNYKAEQLYAGDVRQFEEEVARVLRESFAKKGLELDFFGVRGIDFSEEYVDAVERKQIEKEKVIAEKYRAEQEKYRKEQMITKAQAEAEAQRLLQQTLTDLILKKMWIEKWDGKLPQVVTDSKGVVWVKLNEGN